MEERDHSDRESILSKLPDTSNHARRKKNERKRNSEGHKEIHNACRQKKNRGWGERYMQTGEGKRRNLGEEERKKEKERRHLLT